MNSKKLAILAIIGLLVVGGAGFGYYTMKMNAESFKGIAIPVKGLDEELCKTWEGAFQEALKQDAVLQEIVDKTEYSSKLGVPSGEAVGHLKDAVKVQYKRNKNSIEIGLTGKRKQDAMLMEIATEVYRSAEKEVASKEPTFLQFLKANSENR